MLILYGFVDVAGGKARQPKLEILGEVFFRESDLFKAHEFLLRLFRGF